MEIFKKELAFVIYIWSFTFLRPILHFFPSLSTIILLGVSIGCLVLSLSAKSFIKTKEVYNSYFYIIGLFLIFLLDNAFRNTDYSFDLLYNLVYSVIIPLFLFTSISNFKAILLYNSWFSLVLIFLLGLDPFYEYSIFTDYMNYGVKLALPAYIGCYIGYKYLKKKVFILGVVFSLACVLFFSNRSCLLSAIFFTIVINYLSSKNKIKTIILILFSVLTFYLFSFFLVDFLKLLYSYIVSMDYNSYSLYKIIYQLENNNNLDVVLSGRDHIWDNAIYLIDENPIFGTGSSFFLANFGTYPHNIILDILLSFGFVGLITLVVILSKSFVRYQRMQDLDLKIICTWFLFLWFPILFFSLTYSVSFPLWIFIYIMFYKQN